MLFLSLCNGLHQCWVTFIANTNIDKKSHGNKEFKPKLRPSNTYMKILTSSSLTMILMPETTVLSLVAFESIISSKPCVIVPSSSTSSIARLGSSCERHTHISFCLRERQCVMMSQMNCATLLCFSDSASQPRMLINRGMRRCCFNHYKKGTKIMA